MCTHAPWPWASPSTCLFQFLICQMLISGLPASDRRVKVERDRKCFQGSTMPQFLTASSLLCWSPGIRSPRSVLPTQLGCGQQPRVAEMEMG